MCACVCFFWGGVLVQFISMIVRAVIICAVLEGGSYDAIHWLKTNCVVTSTESIAFRFRDQVPLGLIKKQSSPQVFETKSHNRSSLMNKRELCKNTANFRDQGPKSIKSTSIWSSWKRLASLHSLHMAAPSGFAVIGLFRTSIVDFCNACRKSTAKLCHH